MFSVGKRSGQFVPELLGMAPGDRLPSMLKFARVAEQVYHDGSAEVWLGDARRLPFADSSVQLIVTSPPYNAGVMYEGYDDRQSWHHYWDGLIAPAIKECYRVLAPGGRIAINMPHVVRADLPQPGRRARPTQYQSRGRRRLVAGAGGASWQLMIAPRMWQLLDSVGFLPREQITWVKGEEGQPIGTHSMAWGTYGSAANPVLRSSCEPIFVASKLSHSRPPGADDITTDEFKAWTRNVWAISAANQDELGHPATFPPELPRRLMKLYSYVGDTVLDPFCGSGTTLRVAKNHGRKALGVETVPRYAQLSANRCRQELLFGFDAA